jgi:serine/threonine protein kinase
VIGRGAMGEVYEAAHAQTGARAAVKLLHLDGLRRPDLVKRFLREARIAASLDAANVVRVVEVGDLSSPFPYIAMERLEGEDLADHLRGRGPMSLDAVIRLVREVGAGLEAARDAGIVHRDLKPRNVFLVRDGAAKILDFGVSRLADSEGTLEGLVGTPGYMAPEQARGETVTPSADLFSLGVIAYRALTGRPAFAGEHVAEILHKLTASMPPRPSEIIRARPMHRQIDLVLAIAMAKEPADRFDSGRQFADALEAARAGKLARPLISRAQRMLAELPWARSEVREAVSTVA